MLVEGFLALLDIKFYTTVLFISCTGREGTWGIKDISHKISWLYVLSPHLKVFPQQRNLCLAAGGQTTLWPAELSEEIITQKDAQLAQ